MRLQKSSVPQSHCVGCDLLRLGLAGTAYATSAAVMQWLEVLVGFGIAGLGFGVILAIVGRAASPENRSMALAIATAAGSAGQIVGPLLIQQLLVMVGRMFSLQ